MREAAVLPLTFLTAWEGLVDNAKVNQGKLYWFRVVLVALVIWLFSLQNRSDANVWATGRTADQSLISELGATPLDYTTASSDDIIAASP